MNLYEELLNSDEYLSADKAEKMLEVVAQYGESSNLGTEGSEVQYIIDIFPEILNKLGRHQLGIFLSGTEFKSILASLLHDNIETFAHELSSRDKDEVEFIFKSLLFSYPDYLSTIFEGKIADFYHGLQNDKFFFMSFFTGLEIVEEKMQSDDDKTRVRNLILEKERVYKSIISDKTVHPWNVEELVWHFIEMGENEFIEDNMQSIAETTDTPLETLSVLTKNGFDTSVYRKTIDKRDLMEIVKEIISKKRFIDFEKSKDTVDVVTLMIDELLKSQGLGASQIELIGDGGYSSVYQIGDKVVKLGKSPRTYKIPKNSRRFIQPIVRFEIPIESEHGREGLAFEVTELCESARDIITEEELYRIYKELRENGMIWTDCKASNIGILKKNNEVHYSRIKDARDANTGFQENNEIEVLPAGKYVILDLDYIFGENDSNIVYPKGGTLSSEMERRFLTERNRRIESGEIE